VLLEAKARARRGGAIADAATLRGAFLATLRAFHGAHRTFVLASKNLLTTTDTAVASTRRVMVPAAPTG